MDVDVLKLLGTIHNLASKYLSVLPPVNIQVFNHIIV